MAVADRYTAAVACPLLLGLCNNDMHGKVCDDEVSPPHQSFCREKDNSKYFRRYAKERSWLAFGVIFVLGDMTK